MSKRSSLLLISLVVGCAGASHAIATSGQDIQRRKTLPPSREQVKDAVQTHRAQEREQILRDEAMVGRRMTPAERAQLREQLRREWEQRSVGSAAEVLPASATENARWSWRTIFPWNRSRP